MFLQNCYMFLPNRVNTALIQRCERKLHIMTIAVPRTEVSVRGMSLHKSDVNTIESETCSSFVKKNTFLYENSCVRLYSLLQ
jgi:hypothetical protein